MCRRHGLPRRARHCLRYLVSLRHPGAPWQQEISGPAHTLAQQFPDNLLSEPRCAQEIGLFIEHAALDHGSVFMDSSIEQITSDVLEAVEPDDDFPVTYAKDS